MKKMSIVLFIVVIRFFFAEALLAQANQSFLLVNKTGVTICKLFVAPVTDSENWSSNLFAYNTLENEGSIKILIDKSKFPADCVWDIKIFDGNNNSLSWFDIELCGHSKITLYWNSKDNKGYAETN